MAEYLPRRVDPSYDTERDTDLNAARRARDVVEAEQDDFLILTGSYSIEALTNGNISHNDVDTNVFTKNVPRAIARVGLQLSTPDILPGSSPIKGTRADRLEYDIQGPASDNRKLELQFVEIEDVDEHEDGADFWLPSRDGREIVVPTVNHTLQRDNGESLNFRVKTLPFTIATWALRISGVAEAQKRAVRQTDIDHFAFLANSPHETDEVVEAMQRHPQMPADHSAHDALEIALRKANL
jgi:hypothetical protein